MSWFGPWFGRWFGDWFGAGETPAGPPTPFDVRVTDNRVGVAAVDTGYECRVVDSGAHVVATPTTTVTVVSNAAYVQIVRVIDG